VEDVLEHLATVLRIRWNDTRTALLAGGAWATGPQPKEITASNVQWGPELSPTADPQIELTWGDAEEFRQYLGDKIDIAWKVRIACFFRPNFAPAELDLLSSRYSKVMYDTLKYYYNYNRTGTILKLKPTRTDSVAIVSQDRRQIEEVAALVEFIAWARHQNPQPLGT